MPARVAVIGAGITGLSAAFDLSRAGTDVSIFDASSRPGGRVATSPFAGVDHVDEGADAFLARVPDAVALAAEVGLADDLVTPEPVGGAVWHDGLHPIPEGLVLGLPGRLAPLARTTLLSPRGKARAALDLVLPPTSTEADSIGAFVRARLGDQVHERLVDALVGSIYAADTDRFSLHEVPQLAALATSHRSVLVAARRQLRASRQAGTATAAAGPVFAAPRTGVGGLIAALGSSIDRHGAEWVMGDPVRSVRRAPSGWTVDDEPFDRVILAVPAAAAANLLDGDGHADAIRLLASSETADVAMITLHVPDGRWPDRVRGLSGYLVPKPVQRDVTAVSFGSQKWAHWRPPAGGQILRASIGRDGTHALESSDDELVGKVLADVRRHLSVELEPTATRVTRWPAAFAQYRPHHSRWVASIRRALPTDVLVAGASYDGIGIPACIRSGRAAARQVLEGR